MKKFNLFKEIIAVNKPSLLQAINTSKLFAITTSGEVLQKPFGEKEILIFSAKIAPKRTSALLPMKAPDLADIFGTNYQIVEDDDRVLIKAFSNWQALIKLNTPQASYDDTTGDGVDEFSNNELEDIGWNATEFNITYRTLVELLEEKCEGTLLCIEQKEPTYQFSGLGYLTNDAQAKEILFNYCQTTINHLIKNDPKYRQEILSDDEIEAAEFFECL